MNAQQTWKRGWYLWQSGDLERGSTIMHDQRRAAALERICARQAREIERYRTALESISHYDVRSQYGEGICPYGCDTPNIAQQALKA
jgi:hypothetical protein